MGLVPLDGSEEPRALFGSDFTEGSASISPDSRFIAYASDESGQMEVYATSFPDPGRIVQLSTDRGRDPVVDAVRAGRYLQSSIGALFEVPVTFTPELRAGPPKERSQTPFLTSAGREYDIHPDGERFVLGGQSRVLPTKMIVVTHWIEELNRLVPDN